MRRRKGSISSSVEYPKIFHLWKVAKEKYPVNQRCRVEAILIVAQCLGDWVARWAWRRWWSTGTLWRGSSHKEKIFLTSPGWLTSMAKAAVVWEACYGRDEDVHCHSPLLCFRLLSEVNWVVSIVKSSSLSAVHANNMFSSGRKITELELRFETSVASVLFWVFLDFRCRLAQWWTVYSNSRRSFRSTVRLAPRGEFVLGVMSTRDSATCLARCSVQGLATAVSIAPIANKG